MAQPRELRRRIKSVDNTRQITKTMEMVATSKLKRAQDRVVASRPYAKALADVIAGLYDPSLAERFPLLRRSHGELHKVALVGLTSNRGLCGGFNANLIKMVRKRVAELEGNGTEVELHLIGRKGIGYFKYVGRDIAAKYDEFTDRPSMEDAISVIAPLVARFEVGEVDAVELIFAKFVTAISTPPTTLRVLPVELSDAPATEDDGADTRRYQPNYLLRPSALDIVDAVLPLYVRNQMYRAMVETAAAEQGARRTAMKNATDNAGEMLDTLRRTYNRARQAQITQELAEIVGGAEALD